VGVREFDDHGVHWRVWEVLPASDATRSPVLGSLPLPKTPWLCFETEDGANKRRLFDYPRNWSELPAGELMRLWTEAELVEKRKRQSRDQGSDPGPRV
jgi:hypothetical protein